jgi:pseudouridine kinase
MTAREPGIVCIGAIARDRKYHLSGEVVLGTSNPATSSVDFGGIAHNVAVNLCRLEVPATLLTVIGDDPTGEEMLAYLRLHRVDISLVERSPSAPSANYVAVLAPDGMLVVGIADMRVFDELDAARFARHAGHLADASWVFVDTNVTPGFLEACIAHRLEHDYRLAVNTASGIKAKRLPVDLRGVDYLFCSDAEAIAYLDERLASTPMRRAKALRERGAQCVVLTMGERGAIVADDRGTTTLPAVPAVVRDDTGAGDALIAGTLRGLIAGRALRESVADGTLLAALTIESSSTVAPDLSVGLLDHNRDRLVHAAPSV